MKTITNMMYPTLVALSLVCFGLSPTAQAQLSPPPDGGYPGQNTAEGDDALFSLTDGTDNTAVGFDALYSHTEGFGCTAIGSQALYSNTIGSHNIAIGFQALYSNIFGSRNVAIGLQTLIASTTGMRNTGTGFEAVALNTTGSNNSGYGHKALFSNTTGGGNIALGSDAGFNLTTGDNNIDIGNAGVAGESSTIRIGTQGTQTRTFIAGISGTTMPGGTGVVIDANGRLGVKPSSKRFKDEIKPMDKASEAILALNPVTFRYKKELDADGIPQFGLVAEDVAKVNPDLVVKDAQGKVYTVRYEAVNAMLLNEFLKEHRKNEEQQKQINVLTAQLKEQSAQIQKVSAQLETSKPAPQVVNNNQ
jgi:Chaperone of endosialidase